MNTGFPERLQRELDGFKSEGVYKRLNTLTTPQAPWVEIP